MVLRYCGIHTCENFTGSHVSTGVRIFSSICTRYDPKRYQAWINEIQKYQNVSGNIRVCELHFEKRFLMPQSNGQIKLAQDAVPTIFKVKPKDVEKDDKFELQASLRTYSAMPRQLNENRPVQPISPTRVELIEPKVEPPDENDVPEQIIPSVPVELPNETKLCVNCIQQDVQIQRLQAKVAELQATCRELRLENSKCRRTIKQYGSLNKCSMCHEKYYGKEHICNGQPEIACGYCEQMHTSTSDLVKHLNDDHHQKTFYRCELCPKIYAMKILLQFHEKSHRNTEFLLRCDICNEKCHTKYQMQEHMNECHSGDTKCGVLKMFQCGTCGKCFETGADLSLHVKLGHIQIPVNLIECYICKANFRSLGAAKDHFKRHVRDERCSVCLEMCTIRELEEHMCNGQKSIDCAYCKQPFNVMKNLLHHLTNCNKERVFHNCDNCVKHFGMQFLKELHMKFHKTILKKHFCDICSNYFASKQNLTIHKKMHDSERDFLCDKCGKDFPSAASLSHHKKGHSGKTFKCPQCDRTFNRKNHLNRHSFVHRNMKFKCDVCSTECIDPWALRIHSKIHKRKESDPKHSCTLCEKQFLSAKNLRNHLKFTHTTARRFECEYCSQTYKHKGDMNKHKRTMHLGGDMYKCSECTKRFRFVWELKRHKFEHYVPPTDGKS